MAETELRSDENARAEGGLCLAIDTTGGRCSACLFDMTAMKVRASAEPSIGLGHAERLMGIVDAVLAEARATYSDLSRIAVAVGPGSFTGIRVGVAAARGLSLALEVPAVGIGVLEALAEPHLGKGSAVLAVQDARRGEVYAALYASDGTMLREAAAIAPDALAQFVAPAGNAPLVVTGSGARIAAEHLPAGRVHVAAADGASIASIARLGARRAPGGPVSPLYLRMADAKPQAPTGLLQRTSSSNPAPTLR